MEDLAAVIGVGVAGVCMGLTVHSGSPIPDAVGTFCWEAFWVGLPLFSSIQMLQL
jgi:hypothetical protein